MIKVVIDTNVLLQSIGRSSIHRPIWNAFIEGKIILAVSSFILLEYEEILGARVSKLAADLVVNLLLKSDNVVSINPDFYWNAILKDPDDNKFVDVAVAANVDYIVTNDGHFNVLKRLVFPKLEVISADDFLSLLNREFKVNY